MTKFHLIINSPYVHVMSFHSKYKTKRNKICLKKWHENSLVSILTHLIDPTPGGGEGGGGGGYCRILAILVLAAVKGMFFKQFTLG